MMKQSGRRRHSARRSWMPVMSVMLSLLTVMLLAFFVTALQNSTEYFADEGMHTVRNQTADQAGTLQSSISARLAKVRQLADSLSGVTDEEKLDGLGRQAVKNNMTSLQFLQGRETQLHFGDGVGFSFLHPEANSQPSDTDKIADNEQAVDTADAMTSIDTDAAGAFERLVVGRVPGCSGLFTDNSLGVVSIAIYLPVSGNPTVNGLVACYPATEMIATPAPKQKALVFDALAMSDGKILQMNRKDTFPADASHNLYTYLDRVSSDHALRDTLKSNVSLGKESSFSFTAGGHTYFAGAWVNRQLGENCVVLQVYDKNELLAGKYSQYDLLVGSGVGISLLAVLMLVLCLWTAYDRNKKLAFLRDDDLALDCTGYHSFLRQAESLLSINRAATFAVVCVGISDYPVISHQMTPEQQNTLLHQMSRLVRELLYDQEAYGHLRDDEFVLLLKGGVSADLTKRMNLLTKQVAVLPAVTQIDLMPTLNVGVFVPDRNRKFSMQDMLDRATIAKKAHKGQRQLPYVVYDAKIRDAYVKRHIEQSAGDQEHHTVQ